MFNLVAIKLKILKILQSEEFLWDLVEIIIRIVKGF